MAKPQAKRATKKAAMKPERPILKDRHFYRLPDGTEFWAAHKYNHPDTKGEFWMLYSEDMSAGNVHCLSVEQDETIWEWRDAWMKDDPDAPYRPTSWTTSDLLEVTSGGSPRMKIEDLAIYRFFKTSDKVPRGTPRLDAKREQLIMAVWRSSGYEYVEAERLYRPRSVFEFVERDGSDPRYDIDKERKGGPNTHAGTTTLTFSGSDIPVGFTLEPTQTRGVRCERCGATAFTLAEVQHKGHRGTGSKTPKAAPRKTAAKKTVKKTATKKKR